MENKHAGSSFDSWLEEESILDECSDEAKNRLHEHEQMKFGSNLLNKFLCRLALNIFLITICSFAFLFITKKYDFDIWFLHTFSMYTGLLLTMFQFRCYKNVIKIMMRSK